MSKAEAARLVQAVASERDSGATSATGGAPKLRCWVSPGWRHGLQIDGHADWPEDAGAPTEVGDGGIASVLLAVPDGRDRLSVCGYLVDTWCLGVKNALGPRRMRIREFGSFRRHYFGPWESKGIPVPLELAQDLVLGAVEYAGRLGFEPHRDFARARGLLALWDGPSAITFGRDGKPYYVNGPDDDAERVLGTLERKLGRDGFHYTVSLGEIDGLDDDYHYTAELSDLDVDVDELGNVA